VVADLFRNSFPGVFDEGLESFPILHSGLL
jgi:hypothetical protein